MSGIVISGHPEAVEEEESAMQYADPQDRKLPLLVSIGV